MSVATGADRPVPERSVIVTVGEGLLRLTPPGSARLPGAHALQVHVGGAEANVAAGLATLGVPARWFSRVAANPTGDALLRPLTALGVDVRDVVRAPGRTGLVLVEDGAGVRPTRVTYDRADSTFTQLHPSDLGEARLERLLGDAAWLHLTGIDLTVADAPLHALQVLWDDAGRRGVRRSFDVNLRSTLPDAGRLAERAAPYLAQADLVFLAERDARSLSFVGAGPAGDEEEPH
ncbi:MAG: PfkB family carbohydrate kinase, partial [Trueperaceae bacterium]